MVTNKNRLKIRSYHGNTWQAYSIYVFTLSDISKVKGVSYHPYSPAVKVSTQLSQSYCMWRIASAWLSCDKSPGVVTGKKTCFKLCVLRSVGLEKQCAQRSKSRIPSV